MITLDAQGISLALTGSGFYCAADLPSYLIDWLRSYASKRSMLFDRSWMPQQGTPFQEQVWTELQKVPFGCTISYQELAEQATGSPAAARAVGNAVGKNPFPLFIPCHRVISHSGRIGGFSQDLRIKKQLLDFEE